MKMPKFTDSFRYPNGYVAASKTDIRKTFFRARRKIAVDAEATRRTVTQFPVRGSNSGS